MKKILLFLISIQFSLLQYGQIIADHNVVDRFDDIPQYYIDEVKKMWLSYAGESHSEGIRNGFIALETAYPAYLVSVVESGEPEGYTAINLRASRATWGDINNESGWIYDYGEQDWFTWPLSTTRTKASIQYCHDHGLALSAFGFGWCYDYSEDGASLAADYNTATDEYIAYCSANNIPTKIFYTTGPVDNYTEEQGYQQHLKYEAIRNHVLADPTRILFDYADILCYDANGSTNTTTWSGHTYPIITSTNLTPTKTSHISSEGELRLAKVMWWMLARIAGWDGEG